MTTNADNAKTGEEKTNETTKTTNPLADLVGENKKFKTVDDLAIGKLQSDAFIQKLQDENKELRDLVRGLSDEVRSNKDSLEFLTKVARGEREENDPNHGIDRDKTKVDNQPAGLTP